ncbi:MAG: hypothetical protein Q4A40_04430 [Bacillota bacterium]|nr:hypothetical protein [Bacillota bacterium]
MNRNSKTFKIALGGICLALALIFLFGATIVPGIELTLFAISSLFTAVMILETGTVHGKHTASADIAQNSNTDSSYAASADDKHDRTPNSPQSDGSGGSQNAAAQNTHSGIGGAASVYAGTSVLGLILIPNKLALIPYIAMFGYYPILKFYIEKINSGVLQLTLKVIYFAAVISVGLLAFKSVIARSISLPNHPTALLIVLGTALMILYDYILSFLISRYIRKFKTGDASTFKLS